MQYELEALIWGLNSLISFRKDKQLYSFFADRKSPKPNLEDQYSLFGDYTEASQENEDVELMQL
ncbi:MAG: hypothetical protein PHN57_04610 [Candidatus Omnitrophica bacterium]|nr:hypothetical protein [Candidatus Omnitrophota bacterium]